MKLSDAASKMYIGNISELLNQNNKSFSRMPDQSEVILEPCKIKIRGGKWLSSPLDMMGFNVTASGQKLLHWYRQETNILPLLKNRGSMLLVLDVESTLSNGFTMVECGNVWNIGRISVDLRPLSMNLRVVTFENMTDLEFIGLK